MKQLLNQNNLKIVIEIHAKELKEQFDTDYKQILALLEMKGFSMQEVSHRTSNASFKKINKDSNLTGNTMLFCVKNK